MVLLVVAGNSAMRTGNPNTDSQSFLESCCWFFPCLRLYSVGTNFLFGLMDRSIILQVLQVWLVVNTMSLHGSFMAEGDLVVLLVGDMGLGLWLWQQALRLLLQLDSCCSTGTVQISDEMEGARSAGAWDCWKSKLLESGRSGISFLAVQKWDRPRKLTRKVLRNKNTGVGRGQRQDKLRLPRAL